jgi:hypothetical protein
MATLFSTPGSACQRLQLGSGKRPYQKSMENLIRIMPTTATTQPSERTKTTASSRRIGILRFYIMAFGTNSIAMSVETAMAAMLSENGA